MAKSTSAKIRIENVKQPGKTYAADAAKYEAMKEAMLECAPGGGQVQAANCPVWLACCSSNWCGLR